MNGMRNALKILLVLILIIPSFLSCKRKSLSKNIIIPSFSTYSDDSTGINAVPKKEEILYGLLTPTEVTAIFRRLGIPYNDAILDPISNNVSYTSSPRASLNLGVYGVDFGYIKMFGIGQKMLDYILTIKDMSNKLGIPDKFLTEPINRMKSDMSDPDTVMALVSRSYTDIENHLRKDGRESTAGLMLMGGWIEALYITTQLLYNPENPDREVIEKIAQQKYTLNSLLSYMRNFYDDPVVVFYTKKLIFLKRYFDSFDIYFRIGDLQIDTTRKVLIATGSDLTLSKPTLEDIIDYVKKLRTEIVTP
jgi:hypothetical protein